MGKRNDTPIDVYKIYIFIIMIILVFLIPIRQTNISCITAINLFDRQLSVIRHVKL